MGADGERALAGGLQTARSIAFGQTQDADAGTKALLGVAAGAQDDLDQSHRGRAGGLGVALDALMGPAEIAAMAGGHVLGHRAVAAAKRAAHMAGDPLAEVEDLDGGGGEAGLERPSGEVMGDAVEVPVDLDMVVEAGAAAPPLGILVGLGRQGQERGPLDLLEQVAPADADLAHGAPVQLGQERSDRAGQLDQGEEAAVAEPGQNPTLDHLHRDLDLGFVTGLAHAGRQDGGAEVAGHLLVGRVDPGLVATAPADAGLQVVALLCRSALCGQRRR